MIFPIVLSKTKARQICRIAEKEKVSPNEVIEKILNIGLFDAGYEYGFRRAREIFEKSGKKIFLEVRRRKRDKVLYSIIRNK